MRWHQIPAVSRVDGKEHAAHVGQCELCPCKSFLIFLILGFDHHHLQCTECSMTYCMAGYNCIASNGAAKT
jgi:hypothetical protein